MSIDVLRELQVANMTRQNEWDRENKITLAYRGLEMAGEAGEACNVLKKLERERLGIRGRLPELRGDAVKTVAEQWLEFCTFVMPDNVSDLQRQEMRRAFYAGFQASLVTHAEIFSRRLTAERLVLELKKYNEETHEFMQRVVDGRA